MLKKTIIKKLEGDWQDAKEAIVLAGGLGTRLREAVPGIPKCMAPVAGHPFLYYVINELRRQGIQKIIFSLGYMHEVIATYLDKEFNTLQYEICVEPTPLGTGGAILLALQKTSKANIFVINGDTYFSFNSAALLKTHLTNDATCTMALKPMQDFERYGVVTVDDDYIVTSFKEKQRYDKGLINAGVYLVNKEKLATKKFQEKFSFEKDFLEVSVKNGGLSGVPDNGYFIDIGIPEDYNIAQFDLKKRPLDLSVIDKNWTLFLDRDGVINEDKPGSYVLHTDAFIFYKEALEAIVRFSKLFKHIIIVTNQRGVGRGLMSEANLSAIHQKLIDAVNNAGGCISAIYYATSIDASDFFRKPNPGMVLQALVDYPDIDVERSIMIGNNISDMAMGYNAGMHTIFLSTTDPTVTLPHPLIDLKFESLEAVANACPTS